MTNKSGIVSFMACRACVTAHRRYRLSAGLTDPTTLRIWCAACNRLVGDFTLAEPVPMRCDVCGEEMTAGHRHH